MEYSAAPEALRVIQREWSRGNLFHPLLSWYIYLCTVFTNNISIEYGKYLEGCFFMQRTEPDRKKNLVSFRLKLCWILKKNRTLGNH